MSVPVIRYKRHKIWSDKQSEELYYLKVAPGHSKTRTIDQVGRNLEIAGSLNAKEVAYTMKIFVDELKKVITEGDKLKVDGLGMFFMTFACEGMAEEKECTVKCIRDVHVKFTPDNALRLHNDATATTRGIDNNVKFTLTSTKATGGETPEPGPGPTPDPDPEEDPTA